MSKCLLFFTSSYPYGNGESFIENEIFHLSNAFETIIIVSNNTEGEQTRNTPKNCIIERMPYELNKIQKLLSLLGVFKKLFWQEIRIIKHTYNLKLSLLIIKTILQTLQKGKTLGKHISKLISQNSTLEDQIYLYSYWSNDVAFANTQIKKSNQIKHVISRAHGWDVYFEANKAKYLPLRKHLIENSNGIHFISKTGNKYYTSIFPELKHKMFVSRLGVPKQNIIPKKKESSFRIVSCSSVIPLKRVHLIVETLALLENIEIEWVHFGDGPLFERLKDKCKQLLDAKPNIKYDLKGRVTNHDVIAYYQSNYTDAFINVSTTEGIPVSIMEAMSFGIPCIATNVGGTSEIVNHLKNGILLDSNTIIADISQAIILLQSNKTKNEELRDNAYQTWKTKYNADLNFNSFITLFI